MISNYMYIFLSRLGHRGYSYGMYYEQVDKIRATKIIICAPYYILSRKNKLITSHINKLSIQVKWILPTLGLVSYKNVYLFNLIFLFFR